MLTEDDLIKLIDHASRKLSEAEQDFDETLDYVIWYRKTYLTEDVK